MKKRIRTLGPTFRVRQRHAQRQHAAAVLASSPFDTMEELHDFGRELLKEAFRVQYHAPVRQNLLTSDNDSGFLGRYIIAHGRGQWWGAYAAGHAADVSVGRTDCPGVRAALASARRQRFAVLRQAVRVIYPTQSVADNLLLWRAGYTTVFDVVELFDQPEPETIDTFLQRAGL